MALGTIHVQVLARKREGGLAVVERDLLPVHWRVTSCAVLSELALVRIVLLMAGKAVGRRACENATCMALGTLYLLMLPDQWEGALAVVERDLLPVRRRVASGAVPSELALVRVVLLMACRALLRRGT
jgi:hypothetical protein